MSNAMLPAGATALNRRGYRLMFTQKEIKLITESRRC
jgi:hypothetical protein